MNVIERGQICRLAHNALSDGVTSISAVPAYIKTIIENKCWEERDLGPGRIVKLPNLLALITTPPMDGWGESPAKIEAIIKDDPEVLAMWRDAITPAKGKHHKQDKPGDSNNITMKKRGTGKAYTLSRLNRERPDLFERVCDGELSANAAAIEAGFRKAPLEPLARVKANYDKLSESDKHKFAIWLQSNHKNV